MTIQEFAQLVAEMREEQRSYFATRAKKHLIRSKALEKQVDETIQSISKTKNQK
jgi:hypothetical protein